MIRLLLADDQALVRGALAALLDMEPDLRGRGRGRPRRRGARRGARATRVDVALLDVEMPGLDGVAAARQLHGTLPAAGC